ncbi:MAG: hypothetical protein ACYTDY_00040 [Planctomycetota bacterium]|jgi:hypothetical protein
MREGVGVTGLLTVLAGVVLAAGGLALLSPLRDELADVLGKGELVPESLLRIRFVALLFGGMGVGLALVGAVELRSGRSLSTWRIANAGGVRLAALASALAVFLWYSIGNVPDGFDELTYLLNGLVFLGHDVPFHDGRGPLVSVASMALGAKASLLNWLALAFLIFAASEIVRRRTGSSLLAVLAAALILASDHTRMLSMDVRPTLPCAALLFGSMLAFHRERFLLAGALASLAVLGRWNYGSVLALYLVLALLWRGRRALLAVLLPAVLLGAPYAAWCWWKLGSPVAGPLGLLGRNTDATIGLTALERTASYALSSYYITPVMLLALVLWLLGPLRDRCLVLSRFRHASTLAVLAYMVPLHFLSLPLERYCVPLLPLAAIAFCDLLSAMPERGVIRRAAVVVTLILLAYPFYSQVHRIESVRSAHLGVADLAETLRAERKGDEPIYSDISNLYVGYVVRGRVFGVRGADLAAAGVRLAQIEGHSRRSGGIVSREEIRAGSLYLSVEPSGEVIGSARGVHLVRTPVR